MNNTKRILVLLLLAALLLAALLLTALAAYGKPGSAAASAGVIATVGEGETQFDFLVTDGDGNVSQYDVHTDETTVGDALQNLGLIDGEDSEFGLYVKTVNGVTLDYDADGAYWAFYVDGEYATAGVDATEIVPGAAYEFRAEK